MQLRMVLTLMRQMVKPSFSVSLSFICQALIAVTDVLVIGWIGVEELAAASLTMRVHMVLFLSSIGFSLSLLTLGSQAVGLNNPKMLVQNVQMSLLLTLCFSVILSVSGIILFPILTELFSVEANIRQLANSYALAMFLSIPLFVLSGVIRSFMVVVKRTAPLVIVRIITVFLNAFLDYGLVFGKFGMPMLGIAGAGIATLIVSIFYIFVLIIISMKLSPYREYKIFNSYRGFSKNVAIKIIKVGFPQSLNLIVESLILSCYYILMTGFGLVFLSSYLIASQLHSVGVLVSVGITTIMVSNVGVSFGKQNVAKVINSCVSGIAFLSIFFFIYSGLIFIFSNEIAKFFVLGKIPNITESSNLPTAILDRIIVISNFIKIFSLNQLFYGFSSAMVASLNGLGRAKTTSLVIIPTAVIIGVGGGMVLSEYIGGYGIVLSNALATAVIAIILYFLLRNAINQLKSKKGFEN